MNDKPMTDERLAWLGMARLGLARQGLAWQAGQLSDLQRI